MMRGQKYFWFFLSALFFAYFVVVTNVFAIGTDTAPKQEILQLRDQVSDKKQKLSALNEKINEYKKQISAKQHEVVSYSNQVALIENRVAKAALDIDAKSLEIEEVGAEIQVLEAEIKNHEDKIARGRQTLSELLREIKKNDHTSDFEIIIGNQTFSQFFTQQKQIEDAQRELQKTVDAVRTVRIAKEADRADREGKLTTLQKLKDELEDKKATLQDEQGSKTYLLTQAQESESRFQGLLHDLRQESQLVDAQLGELETRITDRLKALDLTLGAGAVLSWPIPGAISITTRFHDPDYPFRYLFEHSGIDIRAPVGTPVLSVAPGIVAVAQTGKLYGNYVIVIHGNKLATLYAHLSRITVKPDQVMSRGDTIGFSGGRPGDQGAGLSSGPHVHFEVRTNGIPTDPMPYLISL